MTVEIIYAIHGHHIHKVIPMAEFLTELQHAFALPFTNPVLIFSILLLIVLLAPILLKRINVPSIIGLIIAGVIIGPYGLNWIDSTHGGVEMFSMIGLLYIMFIVGLELDLSEFRQHRNKALPLDSLRSLFRCS